MDGPTSKRWLDSPQDKAATQLLLLAWEQLVSAGLGFPGARLPSHFHIGFSISTPVGLERQRWEERRGDCASTVPRPVGAGP